MLRLLDAMVVLLARLHLKRLHVGVTSRCRTSCFRRDAGEFSAYLVDETGELHDALTDGQRAHDLSIARINIFGDFCDLEAGGLLDASLDPLTMKFETIEAATPSCGAN